MLRTCTACIAVLSALAMPAAAADLSRYGPWYTDVPPPIVEPFYVVNQGPVISGPGIMVVAIGYTNTDLRQPYPFIGRWDDYGAWRPRARSRHAVSKAWRRKPLRVRY